MNMLLIALVLTIAPMSTFLAPWVSVLVFALIGWRYWLEKETKPLPKLLILIPLVMACALGIMLTYRGMFGRDASVALLVVMTNLKLLESRNRRDMTLIVFLGFFLLLCSYLFTQSIAQALYSLLPLVLFTMILVGLSHPHGHLPKPIITKTAITLLLQALPIMIVLFVLFPRLSGPLWGMPLDTAKGMTGLSEDMSPGSISELSRSDAVAFRVVFHGKTPASSQMYWRGPVLWDYDGRTWKNFVSADIKHPPTLHSSSTSVDYTLTLEPHNKRWLFTLDLPTKVPDIGKLSADFQFLSQQPIRTRIRYDASSSFDLNTGSDLNPSERQRALKLPNFGNVRTRALAKQWQADNNSPEIMVRKSLDLFHEKFNYTLSPPALGASPIDGFLFDTRSGFCEHFAGSFVFLMRAAGVPARVVTGYQGSESNPMDNYHIIRQSDAHAWAEVWIQNKGWMRVDPTAAVAPERISQGIAASLPTSEILPRMARHELDWLKRLNLGIDSLNNSWNQWILGYSQQRQEELLARFMGSKPDWSDLALWMTLSLAILIGIMALFTLKRERENDPVIRAWQQFLKKMNHAGVTKRPNEGPLDFINRSSVNLSEQAITIQKIGAQYLRLRYGKATSEELNEFKENIRKITLKKGRRKGA